MGALAGVITPGMVVPILLVGYFYIKITSRFRPAARDLKRAETKTRSPIYTHFGEALRGSETIRSIRGAPSVWSSKHRLLSNTNLSVFSTVKLLDRWLSIRLETLGNTVVFTAAVASVFLTRSGRLKAGSAGWGLTQSLAITGLMTWAVRCLTDLESNMLSFMRVQELTDLDSKDVDLAESKRLSDSVKSKMPKEMSRAGEALKPLVPNSPGVNTTLAPLDSTALEKSGWPWRGNIQFSNVSMRYNPASPLVLNGVTLTVPAGTTLGVVGRTGSGKSSLLLTLFRLAEIEAGGSIEIDGVDIRSVDLDSLRQSLAIIPQDPVLFSGTIAYNLDATGKSSPEEMWAALQAASPSLAAQFRIGDGLKTQVSEGGKNLSLGQRQLICLARALLRKSKILVLDEATSSVDSKTDQEVQDTIRREFVEKGVTVITVAHRLDTVLGYDKIAVLGSGRVLEYGSPRELLRIPGGELQSLVQADRRNKQKGSRKSKQAAVLS
jgi:ABC-type multidrug transport system fused ATPase/permease subunit